MAMSGKERMNMMTKWRNFRLDKSGDPKVLKEVQDKGIIQCEAEIYDSIIQFKKIINESNYKENSDIRGLIKKLLKLESDLGNITSKL